MSVVKELYFVTNSFYQHLLKEFPQDEERDLYIDQINQFLDLRSKLLEQLDGSNLSDNERKLGQEIMKLNSVIEQKLNEGKDKIQQDITEIKKKKTIGKKYENPYDGPTVDGVFIDKRGI